MILAARASTPPAGQMAEILGPGTRRFTPSEQDLVAKAYGVAFEAHRNQQRTSGEPYMAHLVATGRIVLEMGLDWVTICAALLHDTLEDTPITSADLRRAFPDPITDLVLSVTKISSLHFRTSHEEQIENLRKMILAMSKDIRVILIKLADRLHNMRTLDCFTPMKQKRISRSTLYIYAPLAGRLGIYTIKSELEDLSMRYLYPEAYRDLSAKVAQRKADREDLVERSIACLESILRDGGITDAIVSGRPKHFWSIYQKMRSQHVSFEEIYDLNALRVIGKTRQECYEIIGLVHSAWKPIPEHFADYIATPKENMYQSIHTKVIGLDGQLTERTTCTRWPRWVSPRTGDTRNRDRSRASSTSTT
jgi:guanosine-3',5'-bis(diphosphate) 3'-pyrophosphohydrolase